MVLLIKTIQESEIPVPSYICGETAVEWLPDLTVRRRRREGGETTVEMGMGFRVNLSNDLGSIYRRAEWHVRKYEGGTLLPYKTLRPYIWSRVLEGYYGHPYIILPDDHRPEYPRSNKKIIKVGAPAATFD